MKRHSIKKLFAYFTVQKKVGFKGYQWLTGITFMTVLLFCGVWVFSTRGYVKNESVAESGLVTENSEVSPANQPAATSPTPTIVQSAEVMSSAALTLKRQGFQPQAITRSANQPFVLVVANRTGLDAITLNVDQEGGPLVNTASVNLGKPDWFQVFTLPKGVYFLREANHPEWTCTITIN